MSALSKPVRLEYGKPGGRWYTLGVFDADDADQGSLVMDAAEDLVKTLNNGAPASQCPQLRVCIDTAIGVGGYLAGWKLEEGWRDAVTGDPL